MKHAIFAFVDEWVMSLIYSLVNSPHHHHLTDDLYYYCSNNWQMKRADFAFATKVIEFADKTVAAGGVVVAAVDVACYVVVQFLSVMVSLER